MKQVLLSFLGFVFIQFGLAQNQYYPGYVITLNGDTIRGELKAVPFSKPENRLKFKSSSGEEINIRPDKYISYSIGENCYRSIQISAFWGNKFAKVLKDGELILMVYYSDVYNNQSKTTTTKISYYIQKKSDPLISVRLGKMSFRKKILKFVGDNKIIAEKINSKEYNYWDIPKVIGKYNDKYSG